jgi:prephenate dehydratase
VLNSKIVDVWSALVADQPGGLLVKLEGLAKTGADLEIIDSHRSSKNPGQSILLVAPLTTEFQINAAKQIGFERSATVNLRVSCADEPGKGYLIIHTIAQHGVNIAAVVGMAIRRELVIYLAFDNRADAEKAQQVLARLP